MKLYFFVHIFLFTLPATIVHASAREITCAMATGYPPFQYVKEEVPQGLDSKVAEILNNVSKGQFKIKIKPMLWTDAIASLSFTDKIDCILGMEITSERKKRFKFTRAIYDRYSSLFVLKNSTIQTIEDLTNQIITGDEGSALDKELSELKKFRIIKVKTKEEAFEKLITGFSKAAILPKRVGEYLANAGNLEVKIIKTSSITSPVGIATKSDEILKLLDEAISRIPPSQLAFLK